MPAATGPIAELGALMRSVEELDAPPPDLNRALQACWYAQKGKFTGTGTIPCTEPNWVKAYAICSVPDADINMMWVRGLLHRVEGDLQNAEHWYRKASRELYKGSFADEFREIAGTLLGEIITWGTPEFRALAVVKAKAAREHAGAGPMAYIQALGYDEVPHGSRQADLANGSFWDHLVGVEQVMRGWGMPETLCLAGLYHSVYGTEGFQLYTLPLTEREVVRSLIGERGELAVFYNCVMDRSSLDRLVVAVAAQPGGPPDEVVGTLKARPGLVGLPDGKVFTLTRQQLKDVCILHYADDFDEADAKLANPSSQRYANDGVEGKWVHGVGGYPTIRLDFKEAAAKLCGGVLQEAHEAWQARVPPGTRPAVWVPLGENSTPIAPAAARL